MCRCVEGIEEHLLPVEAAIRGELIPALLEYEESEITDDMR